MQFLPRVEAAQGGSRRSLPACPLPAPRPRLLPHPSLPFPRGPRRDPGRRRGTALRLPAIKEPHGSSRGRRGGRQRAVAEVPRGAPGGRAGLLRGARTRTPVSAAAEGGAGAREDLYLPERGRMKAGAAPAASAAPLPPAASPGRCAALPRRLRALRHRRRAPPAPAFL